MVETKNYSEEAQQLIAQKSGLILDARVQKTKSEKKSEPKQTLSGAIAKLVKEGKLELSDCSDFGLNEDWFVPTVTLEELREQLKGVSVPIEEYIRHERDKRESL